MEILKLSIYAKIWASAFSIASVGAIKLIFTVVVGRTYGEANLGEVSVALAMIMIISTLCGAGIAAGATRLVSRKSVSEPKNVPFVYGGALLLVGFAAIISSSLIVIFQEYISAALDINYMLVYFVALVAFLRGMYLLFKGLMYGLDIIDRYFRIELFVDLIFLISLIAASRFVSYERIFLPFALMYSLFISISFLSIQGRIGRPKLIRTVFKESAASSLIFTIGTTSSTGMTNMSFILGAIWVAKDDLGLFSAAFQISAIFFIITQMTASVLFPTFARLSVKNDIENLRFAFIRSFYLLTLIAIILSGTIALSSTYFLEILYGPSFKEAAPMLEILILGTAFYIVASPAVSFLTGSKVKDVWISAWSSVLAAVIAISFWLLTLDQIGPVALAIGVLIGLATQSIVPSLISKKKLNANLSGIRIILIIGIMFFCLGRIIIFALPTSLSWIGTLTFLIPMIIIFRNELSRLALTSINSIRELASGSTPRILD